MTFPATHPALARALAARDYTTATSVQSAVLEAEPGRDLLVSAQTGSGKTVAFGLAMASTILGDAERFPPAASPLALIIAPTRELAMQVQRELAWLYAETGARVVTCVGGMDVRAEARQLGFGSHIVVGTPGRLRDHLERKRLDLSALRTIVLDEADEMLDLGFREDLEVILDATPAERQTLLFSATMPREIEALAGKYQQNAARIETLRRNEQHADIEYRAFRVSPREVENAVVNVLRFEDAPAAIVFCTTREAVKHLNARLIERGFTAVALSGELTQAERTHALQALRDGRARVLVATDVAARGLDLPALGLVIHAELPHDYETLLHRSGRTGRAGRKGISTLIVPYSRRRKAEMLLNAARVKATWGAPPKPEEIRARDIARFLADPLFTDPQNPDDDSLIEAITSAHGPEAVARALARMWRNGLPAPEELTEDTGPPPRRERFERDGDRPRYQGDGEGRRERAPRPPRDDSRPMVWFRINIGRERNADPRWLLPIICKAGNIQKSDVGAIRIFDKDCRFEIAATIADTYAESARNAKIKEGRITRVGTYGGADDSAVANAIGRLTGADAPEGIPPPREASEPRERIEPREVREPREAREPREGFNDKPKPFGKPWKKDKPWQKDGGFKKEGSWQKDKKPDRERPHQDRPGGFSKTNGDKPAFGKPSYEKRAHDGAKPHRQERQGSQDGERRGGGFNPSGRPQSKYAKRKKDRGGQNAG